MKIKAFFSNLFSSLYSCLKRFPIAIALSVITTLLLIIVTHSDYANDLDSLTHLAMVFALGIPISLIIKLISERIKEKRMIKELSAYILEAAFLILYYFIFLTNSSLESSTRYGVLVLALFLIFLIVPYFYKRQNFDLYIVKLLSRFCFTTICSIVLFLGTVLILYTINTLLAVPVDDKLYLDLWLITVGIFAPCFFLTGIPKYNENLEEMNYPLLLKILLLYILAPIISVYTVILYAYFAKLLIIHTWPKGLITNLVLWYSFISISVIFLIHSLKAKNDWAKWFSRLFVIFIIPALIVMFIAIGIRINAYGVTENRYFVIALGIWILCTVIYLNIAKIPKYTLLLFSLSIMLILSVFGPWNSYSVAKYSQNKRLEGILIKNHMLKDDKIVKASKPISPNDKNTIIEILNYFHHSHDLADVNYLPKNFAFSDMEDTFGFPDYYEGYDDTDNYADVSFSTSDSSSPIKITGYDYFFNIQDPFVDDIENIKDTDIQVKIDNNSFKFKIFYKANLIYQGTLEKYMKELYKKYGSTEYTLAPSELTFSESNSKVMLKFMFSNIDINIDSNNKIQSADEVDFNLLVKILP